MRGLLVLLLFSVGLATCPDGQFTCIESQKCIPLEQVCDFLINCEDGSDEEFCGSCDFEEHLCGWIDTSDDKFQWRLEKANVSDIPGVDHTTGSPWGGVMHVEGDNAGFISEAVLEHKLLRSTPLRCQISFWYHLHNEMSVSSHFSLNVIAKTSTVELWSIKKGKTDGWENASVIIGNRLQGSKIAFHLDPTPFGSQDVMLDDITMIDCADADIPAGSDKLSCDFEEDACAWYDDQLAQLKWQRADGNKPFADQGPGHDHTTGSGYYMFIAPKWSSKPPETARLVSFPQQAKCVSFWYLMYGANIGSLRFIIRQSDGTQSLMWMRSGTQGNKWRFADLSFADSDEPIQFIFEGTLEGTSGFIALDDVQVSSSVNGSCPAERECTFQGSLCGLQHDPTTDFTWIRTKGELVNGTSSPAVDHTLGTDKGFYMSAQLWKYPSNIKGSMVTKINQPTPGHGECWMFWYHMDGSNVGSLNIYVQEVDSGRSQMPVWSMSGDQGEQWRHGRVSVISPHSPYKVIFEAVVGSEQGKDIAIDDLTILNDPCPPAGYCDLEIDMCGWVNVLVSSSSTEWSWTSGTSSALDAPEVDHTTNTALGHYIVFIPTGWIERVGHIQSELMQPESQGCLEFWYHMHMMPIADKIKLTVYVNESGSLRSLWSETGDQGNVWHQATVDYTSSERHQIVFEVTHSKFDSGAVALDDIFIRKNTSCSALTPTTPAPTTEGTFPPPSSMDCNFEEGLCNWVQETEDGFDWTRQTGGQLNEPWLGPLYDHTLKNDNGFYLIVNMSGDKTGERAVISAPLAIYSTDICIRFWYYMLGPSVGNLHLLLETKTMETFAWTREDTQNSEWLNAQVSIGAPDIQRVKFSASTTEGGRGFIAIDDLSVTEGACEVYNPCGFESSSLCGFESDVTDGYAWRRVDGNSGHIDHTYRAELGHSMAVLGAELQKPEVTKLLTPEYSSSTESCLQFWYWLSAGSGDSLSVHVLLNGELNPALWDLSEASSNSWEIAEVTVSSPSKFRVAFKAELNPNSESFVLLDDISVRSGACSPTGSCDFESGQCTWVNAGNGVTDEHDWVHADGHFEGPLVDYTTHTADGRFLLSPSQNTLLDQNSRSVLISERILQTTDSCLAFWYHINGSDPGTFRVLLDSGATEQKLLFETRDNGNIWKNASITVSETKPFQIHLEAQAGKEGFIAVDDIRLTQWPCEDISVESGVFAGCNFEADACEWKDMSVGQFVWKRDQNGTITANTGPSVDHTTGTELGWYMAVEANHGDHNSYAALQSPAMKEAGNECLFEFYYHMFGEGIGELKVFLQEGQRRTPLWWMSGNHGDEWLRAELGVGRTHQVFSLLFEATRTYSELGDIAIDDISFLNCNLTEPQESCKDDMFSCSNRVCVELNRVCDYSDDCGDGSDEQLCDVQGNKQRCSFEQGMCLWENSDLGAGWILQKGEQAWPKNGPPRDHTRNTAAGHYISPARELSNDQTAEIISSTLLPSSSCTVRFYHYCQVNSTSSRLMVRLRILRNGDDDSILWDNAVTQSFRWHRVEVTFSSRVKSKIVFQYVGNGETRTAQRAVDDISFSMTCAHDPANSELPDTPETTTSSSSSSCEPATATPATSTPATATPATATPSMTSATASASPTVNHCKENEFHCWQSDGVKCIAAAAQCNYVLDCPQGEDEETCGPCNFENGLCQWSDISVGPNRWNRVKATNTTDPPKDHTTGTGHYMQPYFLEQSKDEAVYQSPSLPICSAYCQLLFHFHMGGGRSGNLSVILQSGEDDKKLLWSRSSSSLTQWVPELLPLGKHSQPYRIILSSQTLFGQDDLLPATPIALDDISFHNCEKDYQAPDSFQATCSFEEDLCGWRQGAAEDLDWERWSGPTETPNTGPSGDHTSGNGYYLYITSSSQSRAGDTAQVKSPLYPPSGPNGYCFTFWYHMFGANVGSLRMSIYDVLSNHITLMWQRQGSQENEWRMAQSHVRLQEVHQLLIEASVGGLSGHIAIDDLSISEGACAPSEGLCDFEEGDCGWIQQTNDDLDWIRVSEHNLKSKLFKSRPGFDHTTNTATGYYFYMDTTPTHMPGRRAIMTSPIFNADDAKCLQLWYYMEGRGTGTLNVYQQLSDRDRSLLMTQSGEQGGLWRFAQTPLTPSNFRIVVEGITGQGEEGAIALDDVQVTNYPCTPSGQCDFEANFCSWINLIEVDDADWMRVQAGTQKHIGPSVDHTSNSSTGYYLYMDSSVGQWGDTAMMLSEIFIPDSRGHCFTFWYHLYGNNVGTLNLYINNRTLHDSGNKIGQMLWTESGDQGDVWWRGSVYVKHKEPFWFLIEFMKGAGPKGSVSIDDIYIIPGSCDSDPTSAPPHHNNTVGIGVGVAVTLLVIVWVMVAVFMWKKNANRESILEDDELDRNYNLDVRTGTGGLYEITLSPDGNDSSYI